MASNCEADKLYATKLLAEIKKWHDLKGTQEEFNIIMWHISDYLNEGWHEPIDN